MDAEHAVLSSTLNPQLHLETADGQVGILAPEPHATGALLTGQVGYVITGIKDVKVGLSNEDGYAAVFLSTTCSL